MHLDPLLQEEDVFEKAKVQIARIDKTGDNVTTQTVVETLYFGPPDQNQRETFEDKITVGWDNPENNHVINC